MKKVFWIMVLSIVFSCSEKESTTISEDELEIGNPLIGDWKAINFNDIELNEYIPQLNSLVPECEFYTRDVSVNFASAQITDTIINLQINITDLAFFVYASNDGVVDCARGRNGPEANPSDFDVKNVPYIYGGSSETYKVQIGYIGSQNWIADLKIDTATQFTLTYEFEGSEIIIVFEKQ